MIEIEGLTKKFGDTTVLHNIDLTISTGETVTIIGPSGSGKSTLLNCLNLLVTPDEGSITIGAVHYQARQLSKKTRLSVRRQSAMVFQNYNLFANLTAVANITEALVTVYHWSKTAAKQRAFELLDQVGLRDKAQMYPHQLSGGQKQRIAIARALAINPQVILFDEPTSALDPELVTEVLHVIQSVVKQKITAIIVTHELAFARDVSDRVVLMADGQIIEQNTTAVFFDHPQHERTKQFLAAFS